MSDAAWLGPALAAAILLAGCAGSARYAAPQAPAMTRFTQDDPSVIRSGSTLPRQDVRPGAPIPDRWWEAFGNPELDGIVARALAASPTLEGARATLARARHELEAARGGLGPQASLSVTVQRSGPHAPGAANLFVAEPAVDWRPDLAGAGRARVEQARALVDYQRAQGRAAQLSLVGNAVFQVIAIASTDEQIAAVNDILAADEQNLALVGLSEEAGKSARLDVLTARSQLQSDRALLPPLRQQASAGRHALAVLAGEAPAAWSPPRVALRALAMPPELPLSVPSDWVRRRPDIEAAQAQLRAANAAVGIAEAALYPSFDLHAGWTATGNVPAALLGGRANLRTIAASLLAPVFDGGTLRSQRDAAIDTYAAQLASYRQTLLQAFGQVADALEQSRNDGDLLDAQTQALDAAGATLDLTREGYRAGQASLVQLLDAQRLYQQARLGQARALGQRFSDCAQWFLVMGAAPAPEPPPGPASKR